MPDHISVTQMTMYLRCPRQWMHRYAEGLICPPGIAMLVGGGVHQGIHVAMDHKIVTAENLPADDLKDAAVDGFDRRISEDGVVLMPEEKAGGMPKTIGQARDRVAATSHYWGIAGQPEYSPVTSEQKFTIDARKAVGREIVGIIDLMEKERITDFKVTGRPPNQREADVSLQLTGYAFAFFREHGRLPTEVRFDSLTPGKATGRKIAVSKRTRRDCSQFLWRAADIVQATEKGVFPGCDPREWWCSRRWCGYTDMCEFYVVELDKPEV